MFITITVHYLKKCLGLSNISKTPFTSASVTGYSSITGYECANHYKK